MTDEGSAPAAELAIITPVVMLFLLFVVFVGRVSGVEGDVEAAARDAARAGAMRTSNSAAIADARRTAESSLADEGVRCQSLDVQVEVSELRPGGRVAVTLTCLVSLSDVTRLGVPGSRTVTARAVEVVDFYRGGQPQ